MQGSPIEPGETARAPAGLRHQGRITLALTLMLCLLSSLRAVIEAPRPRQLGAMSRAVAQRSDQRFAELRRAMPGSGVVGYVGEAGESGVADYYLAQYALAPVVVERSQDHQFVIGNFPASRPASPPATVKGLVLVKDFGNGVLLLAKKDNK
ncbi:MAG: hypothetical protein WCC22_09725 [Terriglobales bacterium]